MHHAWMPVAAALLVLSVTVASGSPAAVVPPPADQLVAAATARAADGDRAVMVAFHASWCGWCKRLERWMAVPEVKDILRSHFEIVWIDVLERPTKQHLENPGGEELMQRLGGPGGLPFAAVLDRTGAVVATTAEIGFPVAPEEIAAFELVLRASAPRLGDAEWDVLKRHLTAAAPRPRH